MCLLLACSETTRPAAAPSAAASPEASQGALTQTARTTDILGINGKANSHGGVLEISDEAHALTEESLRHLRSVVAVAPFDVRLAVTSDYPTLDDLERYARSLVTEPNMIVVSVDPTHQHVEVRFGIGSHVPREAWESIEQSGNPAFRRRDFDGGAIEVIQAAARAVETGGIGTGSVTRHDIECANPCTGSAPGELARALQIQAARARKCYNAALAVDHSLMGAVVVHLRLASDGTQCAADIKQSNMPADMNQCVLDDFHDFTGPAPVDGCIDAQIPISFRRMTPDGGSLP
jgi:hypothetical protein